MRTVCSGGSLAPAWLLDTPSTPCHPCLSSDTPRPLAGVWQGPSCGLDVGVVWHGRARCGRLACSLRPLGSWEDGGLWPQQVTPQAELAGGLHGEERGPPASRALSRGRERGDSGCAGRTGHLWAAGLQGRGVPCQLLSGAGSCPVLSKFPCFFGCLALTCEASRAGSGSAAAPADPRPVRLSELFCLAEACCHFRQRWHLDGLSRWVTMKPGYLCPLHRCPQVPEVMVPAGG